MRSSAAAGPWQTAQVREAVVGWFRRHAAERLPERVAAWRLKTGVPMPRVIVSNQQKRWGSCDRNGTIRLNWRIIQTPMRLVDYVVVHELRAPAPPRPRPRLLAGGGSRHAGLRAAAGGSEAVRSRAGVVTSTFGMPARGQNVPNNSFPSFTDEFGGWNDWYALREPYSVA